MTDEREASFAKLDSLETLLNKSNKQNDVLINDLNDLKLKYDTDLTEAGTSGVHSNEEASPNKEQLLENEIKYFKQQIEILVEDHNGLIKLVDEKEQALFNLNKLVENYEEERKQHGTLLEQSHNDKQTLSRALQQNNDLKKQLEELQNAFVNVTQQNLELTTNLQDLEFKIGQAEGQNKKIVDKACEGIQEMNDEGQEDASEWDDDDSVEKANVVNDEKQPSLMDSVKVNHVTVLNMKRISF